MQRLLSVSIVLIVLMGTPTQAQQTVVPGRSIGRISLGMVRTEVWKRLGKPSGSEKFSFADQHYIGDYWQNRQGVSNVVVSCQDKVVQVQRDLGPLSRTFSSIRRRHPHLKISLYDHGGDVGSALILDDIQQGMAWEIYIWHEEFTYSHNGSVRVSYDDALANWAITHRCGQAALPNPGSKPIKNALLLYNLRAWFAAKPMQIRTGKN